MKRVGLWLAGAGFALTSTLALASGPEDLLPPAFRDPPPQSTPTPTPTATRTSAPAPSGGTAAPSVSAPVVQDIPSSSSPAPGRARLPADFPTLEELERMESFEVNELFGLRPKFDIPAAARRDLAEIGVLNRAEGGFVTGSLANQPAALVRAALEASDGPIISRWGHILMRRALASRLDAPEGMDAVEFAALRAEALSGMGEAVVARTVVQDIDAGNYDRALTDAAVSAYLASGDVLGACPIAVLRGDLREDGEWELLRAICAAYLGQTRSAERDLDRALGTGAAPEIDVRLAQRFAGAAGDGGRAVNIEWEGVEEITPWRFALARSLGVELPEGLPFTGQTPDDYAISDVLIPATPLLQRVNSADAAGGRGVLSSAAMVDLYSRLWASDAYDQADKAEAGLLREAYVASTSAERIAAMRELWEQDTDAMYARQVLTGYAAARIQPSEELLQDAPALIASMLTAGLDRNAMRWGSIVPAGSEGWALLALAQPEREGTVSGGDVDSFIDDDDSTDMRKSAFLVAGLAGLERLDEDDFGDFADRLGINYTRQSAWSGKIEAASSYGNQALVALLSGLGMQGRSWDQMTPRHLYHIVRALNRAGLSAEARMIAAEAVARS
ncbi:hypothetical protein [Aurantiacibacter sp. MUD61]|uniref:hypothetical protein n=1 Tax=Aurantiacibacter sp. MUD61 TaxID=3009083 RepID=UPI0022F0C70E|nr:hypothetical protein [Aurantiacibacter sp. MUD61]